MSKINVAHIKVLDIDLITNTKVTVSGDSMILTPLPSDESDYERGMRESMQKIAKSCGKTFAVDIGYEQLPDLVDSLVNPQAEPRTRTEYEKVAESIFDLRDEFERGELYTKCRGAGGDFFKKITTEYELITFATCGLYRKVEKEIDWRDEVFEFTKSINGKVSFADGFSVSKMSEEQFLELCRVALRANGELD